MASSTRSTWWLPCSGVALAVFSAAWLAWPSTAGGRCPRPSAAGAAGAAAGGPGVPGAADPADGTVVADVPAEAQSFATGVVSGGPAAPASAKYTVVLRSDETGRSWRGTERIAFTNPGTVPISEFWLRLWGNGGLGCDPAPAEQLTVTAGGRIAEKAQNCTAYRIVLDHPLAPQAHGEVAFSLAIDVPDRQDRFGAFGGTAFLGGALPTLAVKDEDGWELPPYTDFGESFYSLVADYDVTLDHPADLLTPSSGTVQSDRPQGDRDVTHLLAPRVRDFSWSIGPFHKESATSQSGVVVDAYWAGALSDSGCRNLMRYAASALDSYAARFGAYPYRRFVIVFDDFGGKFDGMEYPNYVLATPYAGAVAHEVAHQWWYALVGDDQYRHPWLDEAFAEYSAEQFQGSVVPAHHCDWLAPDERMDATMATYEAAGDYRYHDAIYHEGTCMLFDLEHVIGKDAMNAFLRHLFQRYEYGVVRPADVRALAQAATTQDLSGFWAKWRNTGN